MCEGDRERERSIKEKRKKTHPSTLHPCAVSLSLSRKGTNLSTPPPSPAPPPITSSPAHDVHPPLSCTPHKTECLRCHHLRERSREKERESNRERERERIPQHSGAQEAPSCLKVRPQPSTPSPRLLIELRHSDSKRRNNEGWERKGRPGGQQGGGGRRCRHMSRDSVVPSSPMMCLVRAPREQTFHAHAVTLPALRLR